MQHPSQEVLLRFALGLASRAENRQVVRHFLARCSSCAATVRQLLREPPPQSLADYDPSFEKVTAFLEKLCDAEEDLLQGSATSGSTARRRSVFG